MNPILSYINVELDSPNVEDAWQQYKSIANLCMSPCAVIGRLSYLVSVDVTRVFIAGNEIHSLSCNTSY